MKPPFRADQVGSLLRPAEPEEASQAYPETDAFWADLASTYGKAIRHLADAGCTYLQLDDMSFSYLCDPKIEVARKVWG